VSQYLPDPWAWRVRAAVTALALWLFGVAVLGDVAPLGVPLLSDDDTLARIGCAIVAAGLLTTMPGAWIDVAGLLLVGLVAVAAVKVGDGDLAPRHAATAPVELEVPLDERLRARAEAAARLAARDPALLVAVVRQGKRTLVHVHRVTLVDELADDSATSLTVSVARDDASSALRALARDLAILDALYLAPAR
jgi:hypothetical protein